MLRSTIRNLISNDVGCVSENLLRRVQRHRVEDVRRPAVTSCQNSLHCLDSGVSIVDDINFTPSARDPDCQTRKLRRDPRSCHRLTLFLLRSVLAPGGIVGSAVDFAASTSALLSEPCPSPKCICFVRLFQRAQKLPRHRRHFFGFTVEAPCTH